MLVDMTANTSFDIKNVARRRVSVFGGERDERGADAASVCGVVYFDN